MKEQIEKLIEAQKGLTNLKHMHKSNKQSEIQVKELTQEKNNLTQEIEIIHKGLDELF